MNYSIEVEEQIGPAAMQRIGAATPSSFVHEQPVVVAAPQHVTKQENMLIETLKDEIGRLKKEASRRNEEHEQRKKTVLELEATVTELQEGPIKAAKAAATKDKILRQQELDIMKLEAEVGHLKNALSAALTRPTPTPAPIPSPSPLPAFDSNRELLDTLTAENDDYRNQVNLLKQQIAIMESEREEIRERVEAYEAGVEQWKNTVTDMVSSSEEQASLREDHLKSQLLALQNVSKSETTSLKTVIESEKTRISAMKEELNARKSLTSSPSPRKQQRQQKQQPQQQQPQPKASRHVSPPPRSDPKQLVTLRDDLSSAVSRLKREVEALSTKPYRVKNTLSMLDSALTK